MERRLLLHGEAGSSLIASTIAMGMSLILLLSAVSLSLAVERFGTISATVDRAAVVAAARLSTGDPSAAAAGVAAMTTLPALKGSRLAVNTSGHFVTVTDSVPLSDIFVGLPSSTTMSFIGQAYGS